MFGEHGQVKVSIILRVYVEHPQQYEFLRFTTWCMKNLTNVENEIIVVEPSGSYGRDKKRKAWAPNASRKKANVLPNIDRHIFLEEHHGYYGDWNIGADKAKGDYIVHSSMYLVVQGNWLEELLACYDDHPDCGVASLVCADLGQDIGPGRSIVEGWTPPLMMLPPDCRFDTTGGEMYMILKQYAAGKKAYRSNGSVCYYFKNLESCWQY